MSWAGFGLAMTAFVASHYLPSRGGLRERLIAALGRRTYFSLYGLISVAILAWVVVAAGRTPYVELWPQLPWMRWVPNLAMPLAAVLTAAGLGMAQPFTLGGAKGATFDPAAPGLAAVTRHPLLLALALWSGSHLVANGDLAHVLLFGAFLLMALAAIPAFDRRAMRDLGPEAAARFFAATSVFSPAPLASPQWRRTTLRPLARRAAIGLGIWLAALMLHPVVIGVLPLPI